MSNNIQKWTTKKLENFRIPLAAFSIHPRKDFHPVLEFADEPGTGQALSFSDDGAEIWGHTEEIDGETWFIVSSFGEYGFRGEFSGTAFWEILWPAFERSKGRLKAILIWDNCDIEEIEVIDGNCQFRSIEL